MIPTRDDAWQLLCEWTASESLRRHALGVERVMRALAKKYGGDEETFGLAGLLHDFDYERHPDLQDHTKVGAATLEAAGYPADVVRAILAHNPVNGVPTDTTMARCLVAADELVGFVVACALVRPGKDIGTLVASSVRKRLKEKRFAAAVDRGEIARGLEALGVDLEEHVTFVIESLRPIASDLGLTSSR